MKTSESRSSSDIPLQVRNEAAAWIMQLQSSDRTAGTDAGLREWLAQSAAHRHAFEIASDMWNAAATLPVSTVGRIASKPQSMQSPRRAWLAAAAVLCCAILAGVALQFRDRVLTTVVGEHRSLTLSDGTRVTLNTATRVTLAFDESMRRVTLQKGEALFEVAQDLRRPFVVTVADREVTALGTSFVVRHEKGRTAVTLVEGKVRVSGRPNQKTGATGAAATVLRPGERWTIEPRAEPRVDRPSLERVMAWEHRQAAFQSTPLSDAIEEMNRYSEKKLVIGDVEAAAVRVSGIFRVGESETFALALVNTYPLRTHEKGNALVIVSAGEAAIESRKK